MIAVLGSAYHDDSVAELHLCVHDHAVRAGQLRARLEAEGLRQPVERGRKVAVVQERGHAGHSLGRILGHGVLLFLGDGRDVRQRIFPASSMDVAHSEDIRNGW